MISAETVRRGDAGIVENLLSEQVLDAAIEVHRTLGGPGLLESLYEDDLVCNDQRFIFINASLRKLSSKSHSTHLGKKFLRDLLREHDMKDLPDTPDKDAFLHEKFSPGIAEERRLTFSTLKTALFTFSVSFRSPARHPSTPSASSAIAGAIPSSPAVASGASRLTEILPVKVNKALKTA